jgi:broad specificity phosphatase PhoE
VALVSHGGVISSYLSYITSGEWRHWRRFPVANCSISYLTWEPDSAHAPTVASLLSLGEPDRRENADVDAVTGA